jgi:RNA polymerase sigma factor (sigma-70 family)
MTDRELLRQFRENRSEAAFAQIVERHMKIVYWTCRRELKNEQLAEDATQAVFILFARKVPTLKPGVSVSGWLFKAARLVSKDILKQEQRRRRREQEAAFMMECQSRDEEEWLRVEPLLNEALSALSASDRDVVLMRYLDGLSLREVAGEIGTTEDTARMRVTRAVERMRRHLGAREAALSVSVLMAILAEHPAKDVPPACHAATLAEVQSWVAGQAATQPSLLLWKKGAFLIMEATKRKIIIAATSVLLLGALATIPLALTSYHARALAASVGQGGFTDLTTATSNAAGGQVSAAHDEIAAAYQKISVSFNQRRDLLPLKTICTPDCIFSAPQFNQSQAIAQFVATRQPYLKDHPYMRQYVILKNISVNGNSAIATVEMRGINVMQNNDIAPAGRIREENDVDEDHWENRGGKWLLAKIILLSHQQSLR